MLSFCLRFRVWSRPCELSRRCDLTHVSSAKWRMNHDPHRCACSVVAFRRERSGGADRKQRWFLERVERGDLCEGGEREEIRDRLAAILVVQMVPHHESRNLGKA